MRDQPPLTEADQKIVQHFRDLYYRRWVEGADTINLHWMGHLLLKCPLDLWVFQELICETRPETIIETGTYQGGSALFLATILDLIGYGRVISVDIERRADRPFHDRIHYLTGSSIDPRVVDRVTKAVGIGSGRTMVVLDSDHTADHVLEEMRLYSPLLGVGDYLIVEDTNCTGPAAAVAQFLLDTKCFQVDRRCERFLMTLNPGGYLRRTA